MQPLVVSFFSEKESELKICFGDDKELSLTLQHNLNFTGMIALFPFVSSFIFFLLVQPHAPKEDPAYQCKRKHTLTLSSLPFTCASCSKEKGANPWHWSCQPCQQTAPYHLCGECLAAPDASRCATLILLHWVERKFHYVTKSEMDPLTAAFVDFEAREYVNGNLAPLMQKIE